MVLSAVSLLAAMFLTSARDWICLRRLLEDVGDGEAPNAVSKSESFRGVELPPAMGRKLFGGDFASMKQEESKKEEVAMSAARKVAITSCVHTAHAFDM